MSLELIIGCMYSGKSSELIRRVKRLQTINQPYIIYNSHHDQRYGNSGVYTHNNTHIPSHMIDNLVEQLETHPFKVSTTIFIDEAQFFDDDLLPICKELASNGARVIVAGLDTDYRGLPFGPMPELMCEADYLDKLRAICVKCGNPATYTQRRTKDSEQILIGETDIYEARCRNCFEPPNE